jgi:peptide/nickel transport system permease protein
MRRYVVFRVLSYIPVFFCVTALVFFLMRAAPGDAAYMRLTEHGKDVTEESLTAARAELSLDKPIWTQYIQWFGKVARFDFGRSAITERAVLPDFLMHLRYTAQLAFPAIAVMLLISLPCGVVSAARSGGVFDGFSRAVTILLLSAPGFCVGLVLLYIFGARLGWLPTFGAGSPRHLLLPCVTLAAGSAASYARFIRATVLEELSSDYIKAGRARGVSPRALVWRGALRQALAPIVTSVGISLGLLLGGSAVVETVFSWPGVGNFLIDAILKRDYAVVQCCVLFFGLFFVALNLAAELVSMLLEPRTRRAGKGGAA